MTRSPVNSRSIVRRTIDLSATVEATVTFGANPDPIFSSWADQTPPNGLFVS